MRSRAQVNTHAPREVSRVRRMIAAENRESGPDFPGPRGPNRNRRYSNAVGDRMLLMSSSTLPDQTTSLIPDGALALGVSAEGVVRRKTATSG
ncbi:MAG: hypothetical protein JWO36_1684 [Myxococcales bacterium]|nr:hypothetical protein [Myxococcales bacterium]